MDFGKGLEFDPDNKPKEGKNPIVFGASGEGMRNDHEEEKAYPPLFEMPAAPKEY